MNSTKKKKRKKKASPVNRVGLRGGRRSVPSSNTPSPRVLGENVLPPVWWRRSCPRKRSRLPTGSAFSVWEPKPAHLPRLSLSTAPEEKPFDKWQITPSPPKNEKKKYLTRNYYDEWQSMWGQFFIIVEKKRCRLKVNVLTIYHCSTILIADVLFSWTLIFFPGISRGLPSLQWPLICIFFPPEVCLVLNQPLVRRGHTHLRGGHGVGVNIVVLSDDEVEALYVLYSRPN